MFLGALPGVNSVMGQPYTCETTYATAMFRGDLVIAVTPVAATSSGCIQAAAANDGEIVCGVFWGCSYKDANGNYVTGADYIPATKTGFTEIELDVYDDPFIVYEVQADDGGSATLAATEIFATANHVAGSGSTTTGISAHELDASDAGTGLQLRIIRRITSPRYTPNDWGSTTKLEVVITEHFWRQNGGTLATV
jgi:hypothetical protein